MRLKWALQQAQQQHQELDYAYDDFSIISNDDDDVYVDDLDAKYQQSFLEALTSHCYRLRFKWRVKAFFSRSVVPLLFDHS
jgi:hypothetical protein